METAARSSCSDVTGGPGTLCRSLPARRPRTDERFRPMPPIGTGDPGPHARQDVAASSVTPAVGKPEETKKALYVVASSRAGIPHPPFGVLETQGPVCSGRPVMPCRRSGSTGTRPQARANLGKREIVPRAGKCNRRRGIFLPRRTSDRVAARDRPASPRFAAAPGRAWPWSGGAGRPLHCGEDYTEGLDRLCPPPHIGPRDAGPRIGDTATAS